MTSAEVPELSDPEIGIRRLEVENGQIKVEFTTEPGLIHVMANAMMRVLEGVPNYLTTTVTIGEANEPRYSLTVSREFGRTPQEDLEALRGELARTQAELAESRRLLSRCRSGNSAFLQRRGMTMNKPSAKDADKAVRALELPPKCGVCGNCRKKPRHAVHCVDCHLVASS